MRTSFAAALLLVAAGARAQSPPSLGVAGSFVVLGGTKVTDAGGSQLTGNVGASPGNVVDVPDAAVTLGSIHRDDAVARQAQRDNAAAYADLVQRPCSAPNVYCSADKSLSGTLTLNGDATTVWIFKITGALTAEPGSSVLLTGGAISSNVFWVVSDKVTLGERSAFIGTVLAVNDIELKCGVTMSGRLLSQRGSVTLCGDAVTLCCDPIRIEPATMLADAAAGVPYTAQFNAVGGTPPYKFSLGVHPAGMTITEGGALSWMPATEDRYEFTVGVTDANGCPGEQRYVLVACGAIVISDLPPPSFCPFAWQLTASGGKEPYVFSGTPPAGMTLFADGRLDGTPSSPGCFKFTVTATDALGCSGTREYTVCSLAIAPLQLPDAFVGVPYNVTFVPSGGTPPYRCAVCGTLPSSLSLTNCVLAGPPDTPGKYDFTIEAADANLGIVSRGYELIVRPCQIVFSPTGTLPDGSECFTYDQTVRASGGVAPYVFTSPQDFVVATPISNDTVRLTGALSAGRYKIPIAATDSVGCTLSETYDLTIYARPVPDPTPPPCATRGQSYRAQLPLPTGGKPPYTFALTSGALPAGLAPLSPTGMISGTPSSNAVGSVIVVTITDALSCSTMQQYPICICLTVAVPPQANVNVPYTYQLQASGGSGAYSFAPFQLTDWLTLAPNGTLKGIPPKPDMLQLNVVVTDTNTGCSNTFVVPLTIVPCTLPITPPSTELPLGTQFAVYPSQTFTASGGSGSYTYAVPAPPMPPPGLTLSSGGVLSGTPTAYGRFHFSVQATDTVSGAKGCPQVYTIDVNPSPPIVSSLSIPLLSGWGLLMLSLALLTIGVLHERMHRL